jgi:radical SAM superfamily enzyme YgiQ (UPF0313 family)
VGSFIIGLDVDEQGIGKRIAVTAHRYGVDNLNTLFLTPLPGTQLWDRMKAEGRILLDKFPEDWGYYTLTYPVARYRRLSLEGIITEMNDCNRTFYSLPRIFSRVVRGLLHGHIPLISLIGNLSYRSNSLRDQGAYADFLRNRNPK